MFNQDISFYHQINKSYFDIEYMKIWFPKKRGRYHKRDNWKFSGMGDS
jgi:hypothetical protein